MARSTMQPGLWRFALRDAGYLAFLPMPKFCRPPLARAVVLSDPVADPTAVPELLRAFLELWPRAVFLDIGRPVVEALRPLGFKAYPIGVESELNLQGFSLSGGARAKLRQWRNACRRAGVSVREEPFEQVDANDILPLRRDWLARKGGREMNFLTRPLPWRDEPDVRWFWARLDGRLLGMAGFDPMYRDGRVAGYYHNFDQTVRDAISGVSAYLVLQAMEIFRQEGRERLSLGLSPLSGLNREYDLSRLQFWLMRQIYNYGGSFYPFKGNDRHKRQFAPSRTPMYAASNLTSFSTAILGASACGVIWCGDGTCRVRSGQ